MSGFRRQGRAGDYPRFKRCAQNAGAWRQEPARTNIAGG